MGKTAMEHQGVSEVVVSLISPYSAELNVTYYQLQDVGSFKVTYQSYVEANSTSYSSVTLFNVYLPLHVNITGLFGANITHIYANEQSARYNISYNHTGGSGHILVESESDYNGSALLLSIATSGPYVGVDRNLNVSFYPGALPSEALYLQDSMGMHVNSTSFSEVIALPYGSVVSYYAKCTGSQTQIPLTSMFEYQTNGSAAGALSLNMTKNITLVVKPVISGNPGFVAFVSGAEYTVIKVSSSVVYNNVTWVNGTRNISGNGTLNFAEGYGDSGTAVSIPPPTASNISIYFPPASGGNNVSYKIYDFLNNSEWTHGSGYFNFSTHGSFAYLVITQVHIIGAPSLSLRGMIEYLIIIAGGIVGTFSLIILILLSLAFTTGGTIAVGDAYEKFRALIFVDALFFIVFTSGLVFWLVGG